MCVPTRLSIQSEIHNIGTSYFERFSAAIFHIRQAGFKKRGVHYSCLMMLRRWGTFINSNSAGVNLTNLPDVLPPVLSPDCYQEVSGLCLVFRAEKLMMNARKIPLENPHYCLQKGRGIHEDKVGFSP